MFSILIGVVVIIALCASPLMSGVKATKGKLVLKRLGGVGVFLIVCASFVFHDVRAMGRHDWAEGKMGDLARCLHWFREEHGEYPASLAELVSGSDSVMQSAIKKTLQSLDGNQFPLEYQRRSNEVVVTIKGIDSWRPKNDKLERTFKSGEEIR